jgi:hypothetical protein
MHGRREAFSLSVRCQHVYVCAWCALGNAQRMIMTTPLWDTTAVQEHVARALDSAPTGSQARLARHVGVHPATVNRWVRGLAFPDIKYWTNIESFFGWQPGTLQAVAGLRPDGLPDLPEPAPFTQTVRGKWGELEVRTVDGRQLSREDLETVARLMDDLVD